MTDPKAPVGHKEIPTFIWVMKITGGDRLHTKDEIPRVPVVEYVKFSLIKRFSDHHMELEMGGSVNFIETAEEIAEKIEKANDRIKLGVMLDKAAGC